MARASGLCGTCGGSRTQHTLDDEGCWCAKCMAGPTQQRCQDFTPSAPSSPRLPPSKRREASEIAGKIARLRRGTRRHELFDLVQQRAHLGATDDELEDLTGRPHQTVSATRNTLVADGLLVDSGARRNTRHGHPATVWVVPGLPPALRSANT